MLPNLIQNEAQYQILIDFDFLSNLLQWTKILPLELVAQLSWKEELSNLIDQNLSCT